MDEGTPRDPFEHHGDPRTENVAAARFRYGHRTGELGSLQRHWGPPEIVPTLIDTLIDTVGPSGSGDAPRVLQLGMDAALTGVLHLVDRVGCDRVILVEEGTVAAGSTWARSVLADRRLPVPVHNVAPQHLDMPAAIRRIPVVQGGLDAIVLTASRTRIPRWCLWALRDGGSLLAPFGPGYVRLTRAQDPADEFVACGQFVAVPEQVLPHTWCPKTSPLTDSLAWIAAPHLAYLAHRGARFAVAARNPRLRVSWYPLTGQAGRGTLIFAGPDGARAELRLNGHRTDFRETGAVTIRATLGRFAEQWRAASSPGRDHITVRVDGDGQIDTLFTDPTDPADPAAAVLTASGAVDRMCS